MHDSGINNEKLNQSCYALKCIAILSVVLAHSCYTDITNVFILFFIGRYARVGVFIFYLLSGYYMNTNDLAGFWNKKVKTFFIPWVIGGTLMYLTRLLYCFPLNSKEYINYLIGNGSYLYFNTVLTLCFLLTYMLIKTLGIIKNGVLYCLIIITMISNVITALGIFPYDANGSIWFYEYLNPYLNMFNFIGIFALGMLLRKNNFFIKVAVFFTKRWQLVLTISIIVHLISCFDISPRYWSYMGLYVELCLTCIVFTILFMIPNNILKIMTNIGQMTFPIYLYHIPFISLLAGPQIIRRSILAAILRPIVCVVLMFLLINIGKYIARKARFEKIYNILLGIR